MSGRRSSVAFLARRPRLSGARSTSLLAAVAGSMSSTSSISCDSKNVLSSSMSDSSRSSSWVACWISAWVSTPSCWPLAKRPLISSSSCSSTTDIQFRSARVPRPASHDSTSAQAVANASDPLSSPALRGRATGGGGRDVCQFYPKRTTAVGLAGFATECLAMPADDDRTEVLTSLPRSRPHRRSAKRPDAAAEPPPKPPTEPRVAKVAAAAAKEPGAPTARPKPKPKPKPAAKPSAQRPARPKAPPPPPREEPVAQPVEPPTGGDVLQSAVRAASELAQV